MGDGRQIKVQPELCQAAQRAGKSNILRVWLLARACDTQGRGCVQVDDLKAYTRDLFSAQTLMRIIKAGNGKWWTHTRGQLWLRGFIPTTECLNVMTWSHPVYLPFASFKSLGQFRAALLAATVSGHDTPISQAVLAKLNGCSKRTICGRVRRAKRDGLLTVQHNTVLTNLKADAGNHPVMAEMGYYITYIKGAPYVAKHLPNTYSAPGLMTAPYGQVKAASRHNASLTTAGATWQRLFFTRASRGYFKAVQGLAEGKCVYLAEDGASDDGKRLWRCYEKQGGELLESWPCGLRLSKVA